MEWCGPGRTTPRPYQTLLANAFGGAGACESCNGPTGASCSVGRQRHEYSAIAGECLGLSAGSGISTGNLLLDGSDFKIIYSLGGKLLCYRNVTGYRL